MRLTTKNENGYFMVCEVDALDGLPNIKKHANKLGQLEDIEDDLGIDLITLFKALKQKYICLILDDGKTIYESGKINTIEYSRGLFRTSFGYYALKDYGKTWALTREELKNGI